MTDALQPWVAAGLLEAVDAHFARYLCRIAGEDSDTLALMLALASRGVQDGNVCVQLSQLDALVRDRKGRLDASPEELKTLQLPPLEACLEALRSSSLVGSSVSESETKPLVLDGAGRLYLARYARYEAALAAAIQRRLGQHLEVDLEFLADGVQRLFGSPKPEEGVDLQRLGALLATLQRFTVLSGGPGTGKTYTVAKVLALIVEQAQHAGLVPPRIQLVAPTGKAAHRLSESIKQTLVKLELGEAVRAAIPDTARTIHRTLGWQPRSPTHFRHNAENPLPVDVLLVDEASMVDVALMAKLFEAVPDEARLILLGDKDQLASVEAGAILGDICGAVGGGGYSPELAQLLGPLMGVPIEGRPGSKLRDHLVHFDRSRRYHPDSGIGVLARRIQAGQADEVQAFLQSCETGGTPDVRLHPPLGDHGLPSELEQQLRQSFATLAGGTPAEKLRLLDGYRVLCAHRKGPQGVEQLNQAIEATLEKAGLLRLDQEWYAGRPLLVTQNDPTLELYNGDVGVIALDPQTGTRLAYFPAAEGKLRSFAPARLPPHETVFAMTIHKSQGSEFDQVSVVLPAKEGPLLTRELLYTALTRAKQQVELFGSEAILCAAVNRPVQRSSGLREALEQGTTG